MSYGSSSYGSESYGGLNAKFNTNSLTYTLNGVLLKTQSKTFTLDAFVVFCNSRQSVSVTTNMKMFSIDSRLSKNNTISFTLDTKLTRLLNLSLDGVIQKTVNQTFTLDSFIVFRTSPCPAGVAVDETTGSLYGFVQNINW